MLTNFLVQVKEKLTSL